MKSNRFMQRGFTLTLCLMVSLLVGAQTPKKPSMQTSASPKETIYKSWEDMQAELKTKSTPAKAPAQTGKSNAAKNKTVNKAPKEKKTATPTKSYIALKTNVPFLAVGIQNLAIEIKLHKHISIDFPVMWSIGDIEREHGLHTIAFQPEGRWWLKSAGEGHFFGLHAHAAWFNLKWEDTRYQSEQYPLLGAGISYGYKLPFSEHWGAEFTLGAGYANMKYNTYYNIENGAKLDTRKRNYWGITRVGASLVYRF
jgi:hypothetical protein